MSSSSSNNWAETTLIAALAAGLSSLLVMQLVKRNNNSDNSQQQNNPYGYPYPATFLQNARTRSPDDEAVVASQSMVGFSMKDAYATSEKNHEAQQLMTPLDVLSSLQKGNSRFWTGRATRPEVSAFERRALIKQQFPSTAILGCSDSRVPVEIVFDCGLGDMFVVRVAGNCLGPTTSASLEYAVHHLSVKILLVMGHEGCGAIKAAGLPLEKIQNESKNLSNVLTGLKNGLRDLPNCIDPRARDREAVATNVRNQVIALTQDPDILKKVNDGSLIIVGAFYEISSGIVDFFMQVSKSTGSKDNKPSPGVLSRYHPSTKEIVFA